MSLPLYFVLEDDDIPWQCILCEIADMASKFPFGYLAKMELNDLHDLDLPSQPQLLPSHELRSKPSHIQSLDNFDLDEKNFIQTINSKHVDLPNFAKRYSSSSFDKAFSLFHVNTRSLSKNFDQPQNVLSAAKTKFDLVGITETKQQINKDFITNVSLDRYQMHTQPLNSNAGGVAIYVNNKLGHFIRDDLSKLDADLGSVRIEIRKRKVKVHCVIVSIDIQIVMSPSLSSILKQHSQS